MKAYLDKHFQRPLFFQIQKTFKLADHSFDVYLDFDEKERLKDFGIVSVSQSPITMELGELLYSLLNQDRFYLQSLDSHKTFDSTLYLVWTCFDQYFSTSVRAEDSYLCHCMGVTKTDVTEFVHAHPKKNWSELVRSLKVTSRCGDCSIRIKDFVYEIQKSDKQKFVSTRLDSQGKRFYPLGMTPAQFILKLDQVLLDVFGQEVQTGIVKMNGQKIELKIKGEILPDDVSKKLREVEKRLGLLLIFHFSLN